MAPRKNILPEIQGLRGVAVILVVLFHSGLGLVPGGYVGVDVFFVISGFLITGLLVREIEHTGSVVLFAFYARRVRRLLPAATLVIAVTALTMVLVYPPLEIKMFTSSAVASALYFSNIWFAHLATDYLAEPIIANPFLHTWSLSVEEQFYLVWPLLLIALARFGDPASVRRRLLVGMVGVLLASFISNVLLVQVNQPWAFFGSPTRAWQFAAGGVLALVPGFSAPRRAVATIVGITGLTAILAAALVFDERTPFPGWPAILPTLGAAGVVASVRLGGIGSNFNVLATKPLTWIGDISYSLYLWHWPVFVFAPHIVSDFGVGSRIAAISGVTLLAWLSYNHVENRLRYKVRSPSRSAVKEGYISGALLTGIGTAVALLVRFEAARALEGGEQARYAAARSDQPALYTNSAYAGCHARLLETNVPECVFGDPEGARSIVLFGDSHATQWFPALEQIAQANGVRLVSLTKTGCPSVVVEPFNDRLARDYVECTAWRERVFDRLQSLKPDVLVVTNYTHFAGQSADALTVWQQGTQQLLSRLSKSVGKVVLIRDTPRPPFSAPSCLSRAVWRERDPQEVCQFGVTDFSQDLVAQRERQIVETYPNAGWIDLTSDICPNDRCYAERDGIVLYHDGHHLTATFSRALAGSLQRALQAAGIDWLGVSFVTQVGPGPRTR